MHDWPCDYSHAWLTHTNQPLQGVLHATELCRGTSMAVLMAFEVHRMSGIADMLHAIMLNNSSTAHTRTQQSAVYMHHMQISLV